EELEERPADVLAGLGSQAGKRPALGQREPQVSIDRPDHRGHLPDERRKAVALARCRTALERLSGRANALPPGHLTPSSTTRRALRYLTGVSQPLAMYRHAGGKGERSLPAVRVRPGGGPGSGLGGPAARKPGLYGRSRPGPSLDPAPAAHHLRPLADGGDAEMSRPSVAQN